MRHAPARQAPFTPVPGIGLTATEAQAAIEQAAQLGAGNPALQIIARTRKVIDGDEIIGDDGNNGVSAGPVTIAQGVHVTIRPGFRWAIV